jgi:hypothetical protein
MMNAEGTWTYGVGPTEHQPIRHEMPKMFHHSQAPWPVDNTVNLTHIIQPAGGEWRTRVGAREVLLKLTRAPQVNIVESGCQIFPFWPRVVSPGEATQAEP